MSKRVEIFVLRSGLYLHSDAEAEATKSGSFMN